MIFLENCMSFLWHLNFLWHHLTIFSFTIINDLEVINGNDVLHEVGVGKVEEGEINLKTYKSKEKRR